MRVGGKPTANFQRGFASKEKLGPSTAPKLSVKPAKSNVSAGLEELSRPRVKKFLP